MCVYEDTYIAPPPHALTRCMYSGAAVYVSSAVLLYICVLASGTSCLDALHDKNLVKVSLETDRERESERERELES